MRLFDTRSLAEYDGKISGYSYLDAKGRIPNAIWLGDADDSSQIYSYLMAAFEILLMFYKSGI